MPGTYRVLTTPAFEREFRKLVRKNPEIKNYLEQTVEIIETDPQNVTRETGSSGFVKVIGDSDMMFPAAMSSCTPFATEGKHIDRPPSLAFPPPRGKELKGKNGIAA